MHESSRSRGKPVFVDRSGRRRRLAKLIGAGLGGVLVVALGLIGAAVSGASPLRMPGFPDAGNKADGVHESPSTAAVTPPPDPRLSNGPTVRPTTSVTASIAPTATVTVSATATKPGRDPSHPAHPTPSKSR